MFKVHNWSAVIVKSKAGILRCIHRSVLFKGANPRTRKDTVWYPCVYD